MCLSNVLLHLHYMANLADGFPEDSTGYIGCRSDFWPAALSGLLGLTNGHLATIALIEAPKLVQRQFR
jgi:hypothetical protein